MRGGRQILLAVLVAVVSSTTAYAQQEGLRDRDPEIDQAREVGNELSKANLHHGAFYLNSSIQLADVGYNQQFFSPTADQSHGISFTVSAPQKLYYVPSRKVVLSATATPQYAFVSHAAGHDQLGYLLRGDARLLLNHLYLDGFVSQSDELRANIGDINRLLTMRETVTGVDGEAKYSSRTSARFGANFHDISFPGGRIQPVEIEPLLRNLERREANYRGTLIHHTFPLSSLTLNAEHSDYNFKYTNDASRNYIAPGFQFENGRYSVTAEAGPGRLRFDNPASRDFSGLLGRFNATTRFTAATSLLSSAARDVDFSLYDNNPYYITDRFNLTLQHLATRKLTLHALGDLGRDQYETEVGGIRRRDNIVWLAVGWLYNLRRLHFGFDVGYYNRSSNVPFIATPENRVNPNEQHGIRGILLLSVTP